MYLSRLILDPRSPKVRKGLTDVQEMHRTIFRGFPHFRNNPVSERCPDHRVLYRVEIGHQLPQVLVQSAMKPDWTGLLETGTLLKSVGRNNPAVKEISDTYDGLREGQLLAFRLRANPTKRVLIQKGRNTPKNIGPRVFLRTEEEQGKWLTKKAAAGGFNLLVSRFSDGLELRISQENPVCGHRGNQTISFGSVLFEGRLRIHNRDEFLKTLREGIGSAKGYGFGLLSIARG